LSVTPSGGTLVFDTGSPTNADFGDAPNNQDDDPIGVTLRNVGNAPVSVAFGAPSASQFSLNRANTSVTVNGNSTVAAVAGFHPTSLTTVTATSTFTVTGVQCGTSVSTLAYTGRGGVGLVSGFPTSTIDFGPAGCGSAPAGQVITLHNAGSVAAHIITASATGGYTSDALNATIPANGDLLVHVTAPAIPFPSPIPASYTGTLTLRTDAINDSADHVVNLIEAAHGAILAWSVPPTFGSFGSVTIQSAASQTFTLLNSGNDNSAVTLTTTAPFSVDNATFTIGNGGSGSHDGSATFSPTAIGGASDSLVINATNLCAPPPGALPLSGLGTNGGIVIVPNSLSFTDSCASPEPGSKGFTIQNTGNVSMSWTGTLGLGATSGFITNNGGQTLAPGAISSIQVTPKPIGRDPTILSDQVRIQTTGIVGDSDHFVDVSETPVGDVVVVASDTFTSPATFNFGSRPVPGTGSVSYTNKFTLKNNANHASAPATVTLGLSEANVAEGAVHFSVNPPGPLTLAPGAQQEITVTFTLTNAATESGTKTGAIAVSIGSDVFCTPLNIATINLSGTGTLAQVDIPPAVQFGAVNCGTTALPRNLTVTNPGNQDFTITNITLVPAVSEGTLYYSLPTNFVGAIVTAGTTVNIPIQPVMIPQTVPAVTNNSGNVDADYSAVLTVTTNAALDTPHTVSVTMGPRGAIVTNDLDPRDKDHDFGSVTFGLSNLFHLRVANGGNAPVTVSFNNQTQPDVFGLFPNSPSSVEAPANGYPDLFDFGFRFTPNAPNQAWSGSGTVVVSADAFCRPLPASWTNVGVLLHGSSPPGPIFFPPPIP